MNYQVLRIWLLCPLKPQLSNHLDVLIKLLYLYLNIPCVSWWKLNDLSCDIWRLVARMSLEELFLLWFKINYKKSAMERCVKGNSINITISGIYRTLQNLLKLKLILNWNWIELRIFSHYVSFIIIYRSGLEPESVPHY